MYHVRKAFADVETIFEVRPNAVIGCKLTQYMNEAGQVEERTVGSRLAVDVLGAIPHFEAKREPERETLRQD